MRVGAENWPMLLVARFLGGLGIGGSSVLGPVYIAELAPSENARAAGQVVSDQHCDRNFAGVFVELFDWADGIGERRRWRWQFGVATVPAVLFLVMLFGIPPSSRWLVTQKRVDEAREVFCAAWGRRILKRS